MALSNSTSSAPRSTLGQHLVALYGAEPSPPVREQLTALLNEFPPNSSSASSAALSQNDAILITYADQLCEPGRKPLATLADFAKARLAGVVSGVHLLPFYPWSSDDGFSVKDFFAVDPEFGTWDDIARFQCAASDSSLSSPEGGEGRGEEASEKLAQIPAPQPAPRLGGARECAGQIQAFRPGFDLMFDAVFNHMSAQGEWFQKFLADEPAFRDFFVTVTGNPDLSQVVRPRALPLLTEFPMVRSSAFTRPGPPEGGTPNPSQRRVWTTFSADQVDLNFKNPQVLLASIRALLFYVERGAKFIRLDAIAYLWKEIGTSCIHLPQTHQVIQLWRAVLDEVAPGVRLITETNVPHEDNISYFGDGTNEAQLVYNFALPPLVLHSLATGNAEKLTRWAASLELPSDRTTFFNFLASHDGIGMNPARGILSQAEIEALVARATAHGGFVSYKHNSDGSKSPYELNITYFDALSNPAANEPLATQINRFLVAHAIMFSLVGVPGIYFHSLFGSRNDRPGAETSGIPRRINRQKLSRAELEADLAEANSLRAQVFGGLARLLERRRASRAFAPQARQRLLELDARVFAVVRESADGAARMLCLHNVSNEAVVLPAGKEMPLTRTLGPYEVWWKSLADQSDA